MFCSTDGRRRQRRRESGIPNVLARLDHQPLFIASLIMVSVLKPKYDILFAKAHKVLNFQ